MAANAYAAQLPPACFAMPPAVTLAFMMPRASAPYFDESLAISRSAAPEPSAPLRARRQAGLRRFSPALLLIARPPRARRGSGTSQRRRPLAVSRSPLSIFGKRFAAAYAIAQRPNRLIMPHADYRLDRFSVALAALTIMA